MNYKKLVEEFNKEYDFLYENYDRVAGYDEALYEGDLFIEKYPEIVNKFSKQRGDFLSSDRELVAFMFALSNLGYLNN